MDLTQSYHSEFTGNRAGTSSEITITNSWKVIRDALSATDPASVDVNDGIRPSHHHQTDVLAWTEGEMSLRSDNPGTASDNTSHTQPSQQLISQSVSAASTSVLVHQNRLDSPQEYNKFASDPRYNAFGFNQRHFLHYREDYSVLPTNHNYSMQNQPESDPTVISSMKLCVDNHIIKEPATFDASHEYVKEKRTCGRKVSVQLSSLPAEQEDSSVPSSPDSHSSSSSSSFIQTSDIRPRYFRSHLSDSSSALSSPSHSDIESLPLGASATYLRQNLPCASNNSVISDSKHTGTFHDQVANTLLYSPNSRIERFQAESRSERFQAESRSDRFHAESRSDRFHAESKSERFQAESRNERFQAESMSERFHAMRKCSDITSSVYYHGDGPNLSESSSDDDEGNHFDNKISSVNTKISLSSPGGVEDNNSMSQTCQKILQNHAEQKNYEDFHDEVDSMDDLHQVSLSHKLSPVDKSPEYSKLSPIDKSPEYSKLSPIDKSQEYSKLSPVDKSSEYSKLSPVDKSSQEYSKLSQVDKSPEHSKFSPVDKSPEHSMFSPVDKSPEHSMFSPVDKSPEHSKFSPVDKSPEHSKFSPVDKSPEHSKFSPVDKSPEHSKFSPVDKSPEHSKFSPVDKSPEHSMYSPVDKSIELLRSDSGSDMAELCHIAHVASLEDNLACVVHTLEKPEKLEDLMEMAVETEEIGIGLQEEVTGSCDEADDIVGDIHIKINNNQPYLCDQLLTDESNESHDSHFNDEYLAPELRFGLSPDDIGSPNNDVIVDGHVIIEDHVIQSQSCDVINLESQDNKDAAMTSAIDIATRTNGICAYDDYDAPIDLSYKAKHHAKRDVFLNEHTTDINLECRLHNSGETHLTTDDHQCTGPEAIDFSQAHVQNENILDITNPDSYIPNADDDVTHIPVDRDLTCSTFAETDLDTLPSPRMTSQDESWEDLAACHQATDNVNSTGSSRKIIASVQDKMDDLCHSSSKDVHMPGISQDQAIIFTSFPQEDTGRHSTVNNVSHPEAVNINNSQMDANVSELSSTRTDHLPYSPQYDLDIPASQENKAEKTNSPQQYILNSSTTNVDDIGSSQITEAVANSTELKKVVLSVFKESVHLSNHSVEGEKIQHTSNEDLDGFCHTAEFMCETHGTHGKMVHEVVMATKKHLEIPHLDISPRHNSAISISQDDFILNSLQSTKVVEDEDNANRHSRKTADFPISPEENVDLVYSSQSEINKNENDTVASTPSGDEDVIKSLQCHKGVTNTPAEDDDVDVYMLHTEQSLNDLNSHHEMNYLSSTPRNIDIENSYEDVNHSPREDCDFAKSHPEDKSVDPDGVLNTPKGRGIVSNFSEERKSNSLKNDGYSISQEDGNVLCCPETVHEGMHIPQYIHYPSMEKCDILNSPVEDEDNESLYSDEGAMVRIYSGLEAGNHWSDACIGSSPSCTSDQVKLHTSNEETVMSSSGSTSAYESGSDHNGSLVSCAESTGCLEEVITDNPDQDLAGVDNNAGWKAMDSYDKTNTSQCSGLDIASDKKRFDCMKGASILCSQITPILQRLSNEGKYSCYRSNLTRKWVRSKVMGDTGSVSSVDVDSDEGRIDLDNCMSCSETAEYENGSIAEQHYNDEHDSCVTDVALGAVPTSVDDNLSKDGELFTEYRELKHDGPECKKTLTFARCGQPCDSPQFTRAHVWYKEDMKEQDAMSQTGAADVPLSPGVNVVSTSRPSPARTKLAPAKQHNHSSSNEKIDKPRGTLTMKIKKHKLSRIHSVELNGIEVSNSVVGKKRSRTPSQELSFRMKTKIEILNRCFRNKVKSNCEDISGIKFVRQRHTRQAKLAMKPVVAMERVDLVLSNKYLEYARNVHWAQTCVTKQHKAITMVTNVLDPWTKNEGTMNDVPETSRRLIAMTASSFSGLECETMVRPVRRRKAIASSAINLWTAIRYIRGQKQIPNLERIARYMQREHNVGPEETDLQLKLTVEDNLVLSYTAVGFKGAKVGTEQEGFKVPEIEDDDFERDGHDWYCFDCHGPGEVLLCAECWRAYHPKCTEEDYSGAKFVCNVCKNIKKQPRMKRKEVNRLLAYTILRLKEKTKELHSFGNKEDEVKIERFIYKYMDLNVMEEKTKDRKYKYLEQFFADARTLVHSTILCYGENGNMASLAKIMIRDCKYDLDEIRQCKDCYHYSNAKPKDWFCQPCRPSHELVYAKQKGFCFWPAKVIRITPEGYDVRFFGGWHQRAILPENSIKKIDVSVKSLNIKRTSGFVKAMNELKRHQDLVEQMSKDTEGGDNSEMEAEEEEETEEPEIKHKKFRHHAKRPREEEVISSSHVPDKAAPTPEDVNMVTSSEDNVQMPRTFSTSDIGVQTSKKLIHPGKQPHKATQTDAEVAASTCNCETKYTKIFSDFKERLEKTHVEGKEKALKELEDRLQNDFEEQKKQTVSRTTSNSQRELDEVRQAAEERCKEHYMEETKKTSHKHKAEISTTKKKQWCYNCEEEAMYHCCWNTSYCSIKCQQEHWHREHKRMCRRKRN